MTRCNAATPTSSVRLFAALVTGAAGLALLAGQSVAQQQPAQAPAQPRPAQTQPAQTQPAQRPAQPAQQQQQRPAQQQPAQRPAQQQQAPQQQAQPQQGQGDQLPIVYSPWTKICGKDPNNANAKEVCLTMKNAGLETGQFVAGAVLYEPEGEPKKLFRVTLPLGMRLPQGTRLVLDQSQPMSAPYVMCAPNGCLADFEVTGEFVGRLKKGQNLVIQAINMTGHEVSFPMPLAEFAKANEGPPTDPKVLEEQQKKLQEELQKKADEARKRLLEKGQSSAPGTPPSPGQPTRTQ